MMLMMNHLMTVSMQPSYCSHSDLLTLHYTKLQNEGYNQANDTCEDWGEMGTGWNTAIGYGFSFASENADQFPFRQKSPRITVFHNHLCSVLQQFKNISLPYMEKPNSENRTHAVISRNNSS